MKSKDWLRRQNSDFFVNKAKEKGFVSRAAFKLLEIDNKFKIIKKAKNILDLGSSPGSWSQVVLDINKQAKIYAIDIIDMKINHPNINFFNEDFFTFDFKSFDLKFDLILSDIAPNTTGHQSTDHFKIINIIYEIISKLEYISLPNSNLIFKIFKGREEREIINILKKLYKKVNYFKPESSRIKSSEIYIIAEKFL